MQQLQAQIAALQAQVQQLQNDSQALQAQSDAQSEVNITQAQALEGAQKTQTSVDKLAKLVNDNKIGGRMFFDLTNIDKTSNGKDTAASGTGLDVKRFYLTVDHKFNDIWSANLTTDFQYSSAIGNTELFVKKAYVQGSFDPAFNLRVGAADMPWIPYVEKFYGMRYVENTLTDRLKYGNSSDWGLHGFGNLGNNFNYAVSVVSGAGYKNPTRSKGMDVEGRVAYTPNENFVVAVGGYRQAGQGNRHPERREHLHPRQRDGGLRRQQLPRRRRVLPGQEPQQRADRCHRQDQWLVGVGQRARDRRRHQRVRSLR